MAKKQKKDSPSRRTQIELRHEFTPEERDQIGHELTSTLRLLERKKASIKAAQAVAKAELKDLDSKVTDLSSKWDDGGESRIVEATVQFDREKGVKSFFLYAPSNKDENGRHLVDKDMTQDDFQELPMDETASKKEPAQPPGGSGELPAKNLEEKMKENQVDPTEPARVRSADEKEEEESELV